MREAQELQYLSILTDVYINPEINNRELADSEDETNSLRNSIETTNGLLQPIVVYTTPKERLAIHGFRYELGSGYRRCAALKALAESTDEIDWIEKVPAIVHEDTSASDRHFHQLIENLQRKDLKQMEIARAFKKALDDKSAKITQSELARAIGWDKGTLNNYVRVANNLSLEVQEKVMDGSLPWSSAKELASAVAKHKISDKEQAELAAVGCGQEVAEFTTHLANLYKDADAATDEAKPAAGEAAAVSTGKEASQRTYNAIRGSELEKKYIPHLEEMKKTAKSDAEKAKLDIYIDALKFVLQVEGTKLGVELDPWEQKLDEEAQELKNNEDRARHKNNYVRKAVSEIKKALKELPPVSLPDGSPNPHREAPSIPQVLQRVKATVQESLKKGQDAKLDPGTMVEGFVISDVEAFIKEISDAYTASVQKDKEAAIKREKEREAKKLAEKQASEAAEKGDNVVAEAVTA